MAFGSEPGASHGYENAQRGWENEVKGDARYYVYCRRQGQDEQFLASKAGTRKKSRKTAKHQKRRYPDAVMVAVLDRKKGEIEWTEEYPDMKTVKKASTQALLQELAGRYDERGQEEKRKLIEKLTS